MRTEDAKTNKSMGTLPVIEIHSYSALRRGPSLLVLGSVHGDEPCGQLAIRQVMREIEDGQIEVRRGAVSFVPVANPIAFQRRVRSVNRDLNRAFGPVAEPKTPEDHAANRICSIMRQSDVLLDLHSFESSGEPFVSIGPMDDVGPIQSVERTNEEISFAKSLGVTKLLSGWLPAYQRLVSDQSNFLMRNPEYEDQTEKLRLESGIGTTEYFRSIGGYGVTLECGSHFDPKSAERGYRAIVRALSWLGICEGQAQQSNRDFEIYKFTRAIMRESPEDRLTKAWTAFEPITRGDLLATRADGRSVRAEENGVLLFCDDKAKPGEEWFFTAKSTNCDGGD